MLPKSRLALIGLGVSLVVAAAWLARSLSAPAPHQPQASARATTAPAAAPVAPDAAPAPARESAAAATLPTAAAATPAARPLTFGEHGPVKLEDVPEGRFRRELAALAPAAREQALARLGELHVPLNDVASLQVDRDGMLFYHCPAPTVEQLANALVDTTTPQDSKSAAAGKVPQAAAVPLSSPPIRHSRPGASKVIYLDFNGHTVTGTAWNEQKGSVGDEGYRPAVATYVAKPYDTDGDATNFSDTEQTAIIAIWGRMAEDYAPFDVDVTTEEPASFTATTGRVVFTPEMDANNVALPSSATAGGVAYLDTFGRFNYATRYSPAFVYIDSFNGQGPPMAVAASHEMGHNMGLSHDGTSTEEYYEGHDGGGVQAWGPLMGAPYNMTITQWSKGEYYDANNHEDDLTIIAAKLGYRPDDHADNNGAATALTVAGGTLSGAGIIGTTGEADRFSFSAGAGTVQFNVEGRPLPGSYYGTDLDIALELYDSTGALIAQADDPAVVIQSISATVAAGTYYLRVKPVGAGTPLANPPSGYTVYGSLGAYEITGTLSAGAAPQFTQHPSSTSVLAGQSASFAAQAGNATGYRWQRLPAAGGDWSDLADGGGYGGTATTSLSITGTTVAMNGDQFRLIATNANGSATSNPATLSVSAAVPPAIVQHPVSATGSESVSSGFSVVATGSEPLSYRWQVSPAGSEAWSDLANGGNYSGATTPQLSVFSITMELNGAKFRVVVSNPYGSVTSASATLTVEPSFPLQIYNLPTNWSVAAGDTLVLSPSVIGVGARTLQWYHNGVPIAGATNATLSRPNMTPADAGTYTLTATNSGGTTTGSVEVTVTDMLPLVVLRQPESADIVPSGGARLSIEVTGSPPVTYQWYRNGQPVLYAVWNALSVSSSEPGDYWVQVTNPAGSIKSSTATVTVVPPPGPNAYAVDGRLTVPVDERLELSATTITEGYSYIQWYKDGVPIPDATHTMYTKDPAAFADAGVYSYTIADQYGKSVSPDAEVTILTGNHRWSNFGRQGDIVYILMNAPGRIQRYDLTAEAWLPTVYLTDGKVPTAMRPTAEGVFIAYDKELVWRPLDLATETAVATSSSTIFRLVVADRYIYFLDGSVLRSRNRATLAAGPDSNSYGVWELVETGREAYSAHSGRFIAMRPGNSGPMTLPVSADGVIGERQFGPYFGAFARGTELTLSADESLVFNNNGVVYSNPSLEYRGSLAKAYDDLALLADGDVVALRGKKLSRYHGSGFAPAGEVVLASPGATLFEKNGTLFVFGPIGNPSVQKVAVAGLVPPAPPVPRSPVKSWVSVDDLFIDANKIVHVVSRSEKGVVRWDPASREFLETLPLRAAPQFSSYAPFVDRLVLNYADGTLSDLFPAGNLGEQPFTGVPEDNVERDLVAMDDLLFLRLYYGGSSYDLALDDLGESRYFSDSPYGMYARTWLSAQRRLYFSDQDAHLFRFRNVPIGGNLTGAGGGFGTGVDGPLRPNDEGTLILATNGRIFDADLQQIGALGNPVTDGVWTSDSLYTIRIRPDGTRLQKWSRNNFQLVSQIDLAGRPQRVFLVNSSTLVVVTTVEQYLTFHLVTDGLVKIATVSNHPEYPPQRPVLFDGEAYLANNPDVAAGIGSSPDRAQKAWEHYWKYGLGEGRTDGDFNVQAYMAQYPNAGATPQAAALYWYTTGRKNGDRIPAGFSVAGYFLRNSDIAAIFANDKYGAWLHYYNYGVFEGRSYDANFIVDEYLELNPDLKSSFGTNKQEALMHWLTWGHPVEDRMGRVPIGFNVDSYLARYPDLQAVFGDITPKAVRNVTVWHHYVAYGTLEGRSDGDFEAYNYLATNPDLAAVFGTDIRAAALHWFFYGRREGRRIPGGFDVADYRVRYPDIVVGLGDDLYGSWLHYRDTGVNEGRVFGELFRPADYLALNPDVAAVIGNSYREALLHWLFYGQFEGRQGKY